MDNSYRPITVSEIPPKRQSSGLSFFTRTSDKSISSSSNSSSNCVLAETEPALPSPTKSKKASQKTFQQTLLESWSQSMSQNSFDPASQTNDVDTTNNDENPFPPWDSPTLISQKDYCSVNSPQKKALIEMDKQDDLTLFKNHAFKTELEPEEFSIGVDDRSFTTPPPTATCLVDNSDNESDDSHLWPEITLSQLLPHEDKAVSDDLRAGRVNNSNGNYNDECTTTGWSNTHNEEIAQSHCVKTHSPNNTATLYNKDNQQTVNNDTSFSYLQAEQEISCKKKEIPRAISYANIFSDEEDDLSLDKYDTQSTTDTLSQTEKTFQNGDIFSEEEHDTQHANDKQVTQPFKSANSSNTISYHDIFPDQEAINSTACSSIYDDDSFFSDKENDEQPIECDTQDSSNEENAFSYTIAETKTATNLTTHQLISYATIFPDEEQEDALSLTLNYDIDNRASCSNQRTNIIPFSEIFDDKEEQVDTISLFNTKNSNSTLARERIIKRQEKERDNTISYHIITKNLMQINTRDRLQQKYNDTRKLKQHSFTNMDIPGTLTYYSVQSANLPFNSAVSSNTNLTLPPTFDDNLISSPAADEKAEYFEYSSLYDTKLTMTQDDDELTSNYPTTPITPITPITQCRKRSSSDFLMSIAATEADSSPRLRACSSDNNISQSQESIKSSDSLGFELVRPAVRQLKRSSTKHPKRLENYFLTLHRSSSSLNESENEEEELMGRDSDNPSFLSSGQESTKKRRPRFGLSKHI